MDTVANCSDASICLCCRSEVVNLVLLAWLICYILLVPVFVYVLYLGYRKWKKHPRSVSHSDVFTFHMMAVELLTLPGFIFFFSVSLPTTVLGIYLCCLATIAQLFLHCLTCMERYLAVLHPITYLCLKKSGGITIRNVSLGFVWLSSGCTSLCVWHSFQLENLVYLSLVILSFTLMSFCSVSVLCVLIRPGPGDKNVTKKQLNHSKKSAFYTIMAILAVLVMRLVNSMIFQVFFIFQTSDVCVLMASALWSGLPSSLVLPLLFLHRERNRK